MLRQYMLLPSGVLPARGGAAGSADEAPAGRPRQLAGAPGGHVSVATDRRQAGVQGGGGAWLQVPLPGIPVPLRADLLRNGHRCGHRRGNPTAGGAPGLARRGVTENEAEMRGRTTGRAEQSGDEGRVTKVRRRGVTESE
eukprot:1193976-Prorocentrum_minimum.AAC.1